jgi:hypothetical protein
LKFWVWLVVWSGLWQFGSICKKIIVDKVCKLSKAMIRDQNEEKLKVYCKGGQENNEFQASLWN